MPSRGHAGEARSYYEKNPKSFEHGRDVYAGKTISIIPPDKASAQVVADARKKQKAFWRKRKRPRTTSSLDCWRESVGRRLPRGYGDRKVVKSGNLPPEVVTVAEKMKPGEVSGPDSAGNRVDDYTGECAYAAGKGDV